MMPDYWTSKPLRELVSISKGKKVTISDTYEQNSIPYIGAKAFGGDFTAFTSSKEAIICEQDDVLILWDGERSGLATTGLHGAVSSTVARLRSKGEVNPHFLYYFIDSKFKWIQERRTGLAIPHAPKDLKDLLIIDLPTQTEQKKIATILSSVDDAIHATQDVIDQTRTVKQGLMQQLLTRGIGHTRFKQTEIGEIPETWEFTTLGEIANKNGLQTGPFGSQLHASEYIESGIPVVMPKDIFDGRILDDNIACVPEDVANRLMKHRLQAGDILFARRGDIGRCSLVRNSEVGWICGTGCLRARVNDKISPEFLIQFLQWPKTVKWLNENAVGQTMLNLNTQILANLPILVPPKHEQINITNIFESINDELDKLISEKSTLLSIKHGLMQDLLTGRIRVGGST